MIHSKLQEPTFNSLLKMTKNEKNPESLRAGLMFLNKMLPLDAINKPIDKHDL